MHDWANVAELVKPKSLQGGLVARSAPGLPFLLHEGTEVAFVPPVLDAPRRGVVREVGHLGDGAYLVLFDGVDSIDSAEALAGCSCLVRRSDLPDGFDRVVERELAGFEVYDEDAGFVGSVREIIDNTAQRLIAIDGEAGEVLVPYVDAIVIDVDREARTVRTRMPQGLLDC
ncbi:ribosome maturation factor RimM [Raoultibacter timonensis]|uniref:Ribosome maturation factor RimM n=1 Tax=Raoultibacter timonensis TaxID=1907662 RepID=A0ABN6ME59_9ACTN|nr:PRC-barrel domain-containing protein [Raoultibacter timonensis]BDE96250.1 hypothetical protein CE91St30_15830 [Raoultibacter timonensis]BDF50855.1 hypothetical protein CE91St31_15850 [Raoultibacter timonensis]